MKKLLQIACVTAALVAPGAFSAIINNGDFATCDFSGWEQDTDGFGAVSTANDFTIVGTSPACSGQLAVDTDDTEAFFANTLFQQLTFPDSGDFTLSLDFSVDSELTSTDSTFVADYFTVAFSDGAGRYLDQTGGTGTLIGAAIDGMQSYALQFTLSDALLAMDMLFIEFQLALGGDNDGMTDMAGSFLTLNNVSVTQASVPAPPAVGMMLAGVFGLLVSRRKAAVVVADVCHSVRRA